MTSDRVGDTAMVVNAMLRRLRQSRLRPLLRFIRHELPFHFQLAIDYDNVQQPATNYFDYRKHYTRDSGNMGPLPILFNVLQFVTGRSVADMGCGAGQFGYLLRNSWAYTAGWYENTRPPYLVGVELNPFDIQRIRYHNIYDTTVFSSVSKIPLDDKCVDTVVALEVLEHLYPDQAQRALDEFERIARRRIVISTPSPHNLISRWWVNERLTEILQDQRALSCEEYLAITATIHKNVVLPDAMRQRGYWLQAEANCRPKETHNS